LAVNSIIIVMERYSLCLGGNW